MNRRNVYLQMSSVADARARFLARFPWSDRRRGEDVSVADSVGRVLLEPAFARVSSPTYHGAAMDGIAVRARETWGASDLEPRELAVGEGAVYVNTGDAVPEGFDAVVMIEDVQAPDEDRVRIEAPAFPWQHVRKVGEDIVATEMLFPRHHRVTPWCTGALLAGGVATVTVVRKPRFLVIPTGDEMLDPSELGEGVPAGAIIESNSIVLAGLVTARGGAAFRHDGLRDDVDEIGRVIASGAETYDAVLVIGGSSAGARDFTKRAIERAGGEVLTHGVTVMPGKPTLLAAVGDTPVVGVPGYPVSAIVAFDEFVAPALDAMLGVHREERRIVSATPARKIASKLGMEELVRVRLGRVGGDLVASPLPRGAGTVTSITKADGILRIGTDLEGVHPDRPVDVELLRPRAEIERNLVAVGSHDLCLDVIDDMLREREAGVSLSSSHVGSLGGLKALANGRCHLAGSHLLDPEDGTYNRSWIARHLAGVPVKVVHLVTREQGLIVARGNPRGIGGVEDLTGSGVTFINRQAGSGTRVLLDYELSKRGIPAGDIAGYETEEFTHLAVAVAVLSGAADAGLGVLAAARALDLDFVPVTSERYELVIRDDFFDLAPVQRLLDVIRSPEFARRVEELGGYGTAETGRLVRRSG
ncbi:MAG: molybdopterin biosynthesis protein [Planctomycetota bacterium]